MFFCPLELWERVKVLEERMAMVKKMVAKWEMEIEWIFFVLMSQIDHQSLWGSGQSVLYFSSWASSSWVSSSSWASSSSWVSSSSSSY